jgi:hypothetical protein
LILSTHRDFPLINDNKTARDDFQGWIDSITTRLNNFDFIEGDGSPEGVVFAEKKTRYFNNTGGAGTLMYVKNTDSSLNVGWVNIG